MLMWWGVLVVFTAVGYMIGFLGGGPVGSIFGGLLGFTIGTSFSAGPVVDRRFDPNDF